MLDQKVIENIVKEVLDKIETEKVNSKPPILVISTPEPNTEQQISFLKTYWNVIEVNKQKVDLFPSVERAVFLNVDQDALARIAIGLTDSFKSKLFAQLIIHETPISLVLEPSLQKLLQTNEKKHKYSLYIEKFRTYKKTIENFGVKFQRVEELKPRDRENHKFTNNKEHSISSKILILQDDLSNFQGHHLVVQPGTIITPLAKDIARERGIDITFS